jgi:hypothetical protein
MNRVSMPSAVVAYQGANTLTTGRGRGRGRGRGGALLHQLALLSAWCLIGFK